MRRGGLVAILVLGSSVVLAGVASGAPGVAYYVGPKPSSGSVYGFVIDHGRIQRGFYVLDAKCESDGTLTPEGAPVDGGVIGTFGDVRVRSSGRFRSLHHRRGGLFQLAGRVVDEIVTGRLRTRSPRNDDPELHFGRCDSGRVDLHLDQVDRRAWRHYTGRDELRSARSPERR